MLGKPAAQWRGGPHSNEPPSLASPWVEFQGPPVRHPCLLLCTLHTPHLNTKNLLSVSRGFTSALDWGGRGGGLCPELLGWGSQTEEGNVVQMHWNATQPL